MASDDRPYRYADNRAHDSRVESVNARFARRHRQGAAVEFSFAGDLLADGMLWGQALRSPHPSARIRAIDIAPALAINGVHAC